MNSIVAGNLYGASCPSSWATIPSGSGAAPARSSTIACTRCTELLVGEPEHRGVDDVGEGRQRVLDLGRVDVDPAAQDEVDPAIGQEEVAVVVERTEVVHGEVVALPRVGGLLGRVVVRELRHAGHSRRVHRSDLARRQPVPSSSRIVIWIPGKARPTLPGLRNHSSGEITVHIPSLAP